MIPSRDTPDQLDIFKQTASRWADDSVKHQQKLRKRQNATRFVDVIGIV